MSKILEKVSKNLKIKLKKNIFQKFFKHFWDMQEIFLKHFWEKISSKNIEKSEKKKSTKFKKKKS